jgi:hypothetical protein
MGWELIPWYTITGDFDEDFGVDEWHGTNVFVRDGERIYRTYFVGLLGDEAMGSTWSYLDITALGLQEEGEDSPEGYPQTHRTRGGTTTTRTARPCNRRRGRLALSMGCRVPCASPLRTRRRIRLLFFRGRMFPARSCLGRGSNEFSTRETSNLT